MKPRDLVEILRVVEWQVFCSISKNAQRVLGRRFAFWVEMTLQRLRGRRALCGGLLCNKIGRNGESSTHCRYGFDERATTSGHNGISLKTSGDNRDILQIKQVKDYSLFLRQQKLLTRFWPRRLNSAVRRRAALRNRGQNERRFCPQVGPWHFKTRCTVNELLLFSLRSS